MHRLAVANAELCPRVGPLAGWTLHSEDLYGAAVRADAQAQFGMRDGLPAVLALASSGPAARAGIREDDRIVSVNGRMLERNGDAAAQAWAGPPTYDRLARHIERIEGALVEGLVHVEVRRGEGAAVARILPDDGCAYPAQVVLSTELNGGADGARVSITSGLVAYATADDDLAFLLAHELAHNLLRHSERPRSRGLAGMFGRNGRSPSAVRHAEQAADRVGMFLAARAGYDVSGSAAFRRRFARDHAAARYGFWGYPSAEARALAHETTWREIEALRHQGAPLLP